jgi:PTS system mannose-specific IIA component
MIGLVVVTHGRLAEEFIAAAEHVVGRLDQARAISIGPDDDMDMRRKEIIAAAKASDTGDGVVILTDMFGGTPSNLAISVMGGAKIEVIAGVNLPMLIKLSSIRVNGDMATALEEAQAAGRKYINVASKFLSGK